MISYEEYLDAKLDKEAAQKIIDAYELQRHEIEKQERLYKMLEKKKKCEESPGGHHYLPDGKYSGEGSKTCQDCGHKIS